MTGAQTLSLSALREGKGLSLEKIAEMTKISPRFLCAIEAQRFEELPGGIFRISYLKQYAECIGMDQTELLARLQESMTSEQGSVSKATSRWTLFLWLRRYISSPTLPFSR
jgi:cytoskeleton protein RodZ